MDESPATQIGLHTSRMYRVAYRLLADDEMARDAVQEACAKALASIDRFNGEASLSTWLHRITVNCAKDVMRSHGRQERFHETLQTQHANGNRGSAPGDRLETEELSDLARRLLDTLPEDCRSAFMLTQLDGYSYDEAAEIEGEPRGTLASRVFRAKKLLLEQMNAHIDGRAKA